MVWCVSHSSKAILVAMLRHCAHMYNTGAYVTAEDKHRLIRALVGLLVLVDETAAGESLECEQLCCLPASSLASVCFVCMTPLSSTALPDKKKVSVFFNKDIKNAKIFKTIKVRIAAPLPLPLLLLLLLLTSEGWSTGCPPPPRVSLLCQANPVVPMYPDMPFKVMNVLRKCRSYDRDTVEALVGQPSENAVRVQCSPPESPCHSLGLCLCVHIPPLAGNHGNTRLGQPLAQDAQGVCFLYHSLRSTAEPGAVTHHRGNRWRTHPHMHGDTSLPGHRHGA